MDAEDRRRRGEIRREIGLVIVNPYGGVWATEIFDTAEKAASYLKKHYPEANKCKFKLAQGYRETAIYRPFGEPELIDVSR